MKRFPIQGQILDPEVRPITRLPATTIPWEAMERYRARMEKNHYQTMEHLADRGGLGYAEVWICILDIGLNTGWSHAEWKENAVKAYKWTENVNRNADAP